VKEREQSHGAIFLGINPPHLRYGHVADIPTL